MTGIAMGPICGNRSGLEFSALALIHPTPLSCSLESLRIKKRRIFERAVLGSRETDPQKTPRPYSMQRSEGFARTGRTAERRRRRQRAPCSRTCTHGATRDVTRIETSTRFSLSPGAMTQRPSTPSSSGSTARLVRKGEIGSVGGTIATVHIVTPFCLLPAQTATRNTLRDRGRLPGILRVRDRRDVLHTCKRCQWVFQPKVHARAAKLDVPSRGRQCRFDFVHPQREDRSLPQPSHQPEAMRAQEGMADRPGRGSIRTITSVL